ncbi:hypothetical protein [Streptomyces sp. NBC_01264]|uniref:hypothetical protein n=1 Tax=Streptomyces sp. NBC_01264 TaxID=2903804 RepID=UPI002255B9A5|nr:hypothetical protein [Streptomyces sp. NBC_01264]MCX4781684.1 hypothetical protein [Streptomyces sp. NBC_01264]
MRRGHRRARIRQNGRPHGAVASLDSARFTVIYQPNPDVGMRGYDRIVTRLGGTPTFHLAALVTRESAALAAEV